MQMNLSLQLSFHGAIVLLMGLLSGIPHGLAINQNQSESVIRAWQVAHSGLAMGGTTIVTISAAIDRLKMDAIALNILVWSSVVSGYGFCLALPYGAWTGHRGNIVGAWGSLVSASTLIFGCLQSMTIFS